MTSKAERLTKSVMKIATSEEKLRDMVCSSVILNASIMAIGADVSLVLASSAHVALEAFSYENYEMVVGMLAMATIMLAEKEGE